MQFTFAKACIEFDLIVKAMIMKKKNYLIYALGLGIGFLNGLLGSGGGMVAVPMLRGLKVENEACHATSIAIIFPLAVASGLLYLKAGSFSPTDAWPYLPGGLLGAIFGAWVLPKIKTVWLRRIFGAVILFSAWRLLFR